LSIATRTPPANFVRLDTTINTTGAWANARDLTVLRENHNKLLCERTKHTLISIVGSSLDPISFPYQITAYGGDCLVQVPVRISDGTKTLRVVVRAALGSASTAGDDDIFLYPALTIPGRAPYLDFANTPIQINSTSYATYECDCNVFTDYEGAYGIPDDGIMIFSLFGHGGAIGADRVKAAGVDAFGEVGENFFYAANGLPAGFPGVGQNIGWIVYDLDDLEVEPRAVVSIEADGRLYINPVWAKRPAEGDLNAFRLPRYMYLNSLTVYERDSTIL